MRGIYQQQGSTLLLKLLIGDFLGDTFPDGLQMESGILEETVLQFLCREFWVMGLQASKETVVLHRWGVEMNALFIN